jgi:hypothetical protein
LRISPNGELTMQASAAVYWFLLVVFENGNTLGLGRPEFKTLAGCVDYLTRLDVGAELERSNFVETGKVVSVGCHRNDVETRGLQPNE